MRTANLMPASPHQLEPEADIVTVLIDPADRRGSAGAAQVTHKEMIERAGRNTFPQIFIDGRHVGGCDDLHALDRAGELDALLAA